MRNTTTRLLLAMFIGVCLALVGCESDNDDSSTSTDVSGNWTVQTAGDPGHGVETSTVALSQSGNSLTGTANSRGDAGQVLGNVQGSTVTLTVTFPDGDVAHFTGTVSGNQITGTWSAGDGSGTFTATR